MINEPTPFNQSWYSYKFHGASLRYEIGVSIETAIIIWANGPLPCGSHTVVVLGWSLLPSTTQASNPGVVVLRLLYSAMSGERTCE